MEAPMTSPVFHQVLSQKTSPAALFLRRMKLDQSCDLVLRLNLLPWLALLPTKKREKYGKRKEGVTMEEKALQTKMRNKEHRYDEDVSTPSRRPALTPSHTRSRPPTSHSRPPPPLHFLPTSPAPLQFAASRLTRERYE